MLWLEEARAAGARLVEGRLVAVETGGGRVTGVSIRRGERIERLACDAFVDAAGPFAAEVAALAGGELPVFHELHRKLFFDDHLGVVPRETGLVVWCDPVAVDWSEEERAGLAAEPETAPLAGTLPAGLHFRPEGGRESRSAILLWNYHCEPVAAELPLPEDPLHVAVVTRGMARPLPAFAAYAERGRRPYLDGGYYTKTRENLPLVGPCGAPGAYVLAALSGFGIMAAPAAGELLAAHVTGSPLPGFAAAFALSRYDDSGYRARIEAGSRGQL
jgi:glycine/D-amino acid oxidase-like deaminating enzyme